jgi:tight adherence protein C
VLFVGVAAVAAAIVIMVYLVGSRASSDSNQVVDVIVPQQRPGVIPVPRSGVDPSEPLPSVLKRFAALASKLTPSTYGRTLQHKLDLAGNPRDWGADRVLGFKGIGLVIGIVLGVLLGLKHGVGVAFYPLLGGACGFFLPDVWIRNLGEHRQQKLLLGLPDAIDMMTVCVEAGLGFDAALSRVARNMEGPIASECSRVLQEMQFGMSRTEALRAMVNRTDVPELRTFVTSIVQASELGISVVAVLLEQSREMRVRRRQRAEEKAQKLPVKILFPLLFCMLPAMFIVVIGPSAIKIFHTLGNLSS